MSDVTGGSSRFSIWNITWMCCIASRARWRDREPLEQQRQAGLWPASFDRIWQALIERHGKQSGTRQMIDLLKLAQKHGQQQAAGGDRDRPWRAGCYDAAAVQHLLNAEDLRHTRRARPSMSERWNGIARPLPVMNEYDQLLMAGGAR